MTAKKLKRLTIFFKGNTIGLTLDEEAAATIFKHFVSSKQTGQVNQNSIIYTTDLAICLADVLCMSIDDPKPSLQERILRKQLDEDEPWKRSLRPDEDDPEDGDN